MGAAPLSMRLVPDTLGDALSQSAECTTAFAGWVTQSRAATLGKGREKEASKKEGPRENAGCDFASTAIHLTFGPWVRRRLLCSRLGCARRTYTDI